MKKVLVVEDSKIVMKVIKHVLSTSNMFEAVYAKSFVEAKKLIEQQAFYVALVDLNLPDAPSGEVVDFCLEQKIPTIVLTGSFDTEKRTDLLSKGAVDYVTKEGRYSYEYALNLIHRLIKNEHIKVLAVDDSKIGRRVMVKMLQLQRFQVLEAEDGIEAIKVLLQNPDIRLLITDYNMPNMDGFQLVQNIRVKYEKADLGIIGVSGQGEESLTAKFIKNGANDFLKKPFNHEEFFCRINSNIEQLELVDELKDTVNRDYYTGAYNHRYFFSQGEILLQEARQKNIPVAAVALDFDGVKAINEYHGYESADIIMKSLSAILNQAFDRFLLARSSGQEFFALLVGLDNQKAHAFVDKVRHLTAEPMDLSNGEKVSVSFSAGVSNSSCESLEQLVNSASELMYSAKEAGGDIVLGD